MDGLPTESRSPRETAPSIRQVTDGEVWEVYAAIGVFAMVLALVVADLAEDVAEGVTLAHVVIEGLTAAGAASGLGLAVRRLLRQRAWARDLARSAGQHAEAAERDAAVARQEADVAHGEAEAAERRATEAEAALARSERLLAEAAAFRADTRDATAALSEAIAARLHGWGLTPAERDVARLLLLGLSHKDIASARETSERTARDQAQAVYRKAGVEGRAELSAFFLEDLLPPPERAAERPPR